MRCCDGKAVFATAEGERFCKEHFISRFEERVLRTISDFDLLEENEHIGVGVSGGKDSLSVLSILHFLSKKNPTLKISAIAVNEGIKGYREDTLLTAKSFCDSLGIPLYIASFEEEFGMSLDDALKALDVRPCVICGIFRRYLLNRKAKELGCTKLATGHNLDDECQSILMNQFRNDLRASARLGPKTGLRDRRGFITRIKPLYLCSEKEVTTYSFLKGILDKFTECPNAVISHRAQVRDLLNEFENSFPGIKQAIARSFLLELPNLKEKFRDEPLGLCPSCGEPSSKNECNACRWAQKISEAKKRNKQNKEAAYSLL